jgi:hypothetical protein
VSQTNPSRPRNQGGPDFALVRNQDVIKFLLWQGIEVRGRSARCPRCKRLSLEIHTDKNRLRCQRCGDRPMSNIDFMVLLHHSTPVEAARQIARHFDLPIHQGDPRPAKQKPSIDILDTFESRGYWAHCGKAKIKGLQGALLAVVKRIQHDERGDYLEITYAELMQRSGIGSEHTLRKVLDRFTADGWLTQMNSRASREHGYYRIHWLAKAFQDLLQHLEVEQHRQIEQGKARAAARAAKHRAKQRKPAPDSVSPLPERESIPVLISNKPTSHLSPRSDSVCTGCSNEDFVTALFREREQEKNWADAAFREELARVRKSVQVERRSKVTVRSRVRVL